MNRLVYTVQDTTVAEGQAAAHDQFVSVEIEDLLHSAREKGKGHKLQPAAGKTEQRRRPSSSESPVRRRRG